MEQLVLSDKSGLVRLLLGVGRRDRWWTLCSPHDTSIHNFARERTHSVVSAGVRQCYARGVPRGRKPGTYRKYSADQMIAALKEAKGMNTVAARLLHCDLKTVENYCKVYPQVAEVRRQERESFLDVGELSLLRAVQRGEAWAVCFLLKTQGKQRGYIERAEFSGPNGGAIEVEVSGLTDDQRAERISGILDLARERAKRTRSTGRPATGDSSAASG